MCGQSTTTKKRGKRGGLMPSKCGHIRSMLHFALDCIIKLTSICLSYEIS